MVPQTTPENAPPGMVREYFDLTELPNSLEPRLEKDPHNIFCCVVVGDPGKNLSVPIKWEMLDSRALSTTSLDSDKDSRHLEKALRATEKER